MWGKRPRGQLDKCVEAAALRKAFPEELGNVYAAEEMEGRTIDGVVVDHEPTRQSAPTPPKPPAPPRAGAAPSPDDQRASTASARGADIVDAEVVDGAHFDHDHDDAGDTDTEFFERLEEAMGSAASMEALEEVWTEFDAMARFEGGADAEDNQGIALAIRKRAEKRLGGQK